MSGRRGRPVAALIRALDTGLEEPDWDHGRCRIDGVSPDVFFFEDRHLSRTRDYQDARAHAQAICADCAIREDCAEWAIETLQEGGIWGGLTNDDRRNERSIRYKEALAERALLMQGVG